MNRGRALVVAGVVLVVVGLALAWVVGRDAGDDEDDRTVAVVVATSDIEPGQAGDDLVSSGLVRVEQIAASDAEVGALTTTDELSGTIVGTSVPEGEQVVVTALRASALRGQSFEVPDGQEAIAVTVPFTAGGAGYVAPGDRVNLYASILPGTQGAPVQPRTELLLGAVEVLDVSDEVAPRRADPVSADGTEAAATTRTGGSEITLLLAVEPAQAEQIVFASTNNELWATLAGEEATEAPPGVDYGTYGPAEDQ